MWRLNIHFDGTTRRKPRNASAVNQYRREPKVAVSTIGKELSQTPCIKAFEALC